LESYLAKYREATARDTINSAPADARVISRATVSNLPAYPKKLPSVLIATVATLMLCCGFVLTKELLRVPGEAVPAPRPAPEVVAAPPSDVAPAAMAADDMRQSARIRNGAIAEVAQSLRQAGASRIAVLGAVPGMKTGETAIKLARSLAKDGRVLLAGVEPQNSAIQAISSDSAAGMAELVAGTASFRDIIGKDRLSNVHVISAGRSPIERIALLSSPRLAPSFDALARSYDYMVVDAGAAEGVDLEAIAEIAPQAVLLTDGSANDAIETGQERLLSADFEEVTPLSRGRAMPKAAAA
jgi:polysaccharide biosynthesis transport protein